MKKILALAMAACLSAGLAACSGSPSAPSAPADSSPAASAPAQSAGADISVYTNAYFAPFEYYDGTDIAGVDVDIMNLVGEKLNRKVVYTNVEFGDRKSVV